MNFHGNGPNDKPEVVSSFGYSLQLLLRHSNILMTSDPFCRHPHPAYASTSSSNDEQEAPINLEVVKGSRVVNNGELTIQALPPGTSRAPSPPQSEPVDFSKKAVRQGSTSSSEEHR